MPFPTYVDSTMVSAFKRCPQSFKRAFIDHIKPKGQSIHLHAGSAFAAGAEAARRAFYYDKLSHELAVGRGVEALWRAYGTFDAMGETKDAERMAVALVSYFDNWPMTGALVPAQYQGKLCVEFSFAVPLEIKHPETGDPLLFTGKADWIGEYQGMIMLVDEKTTGGSVGTSYQWELRSQFTAYAWAARLYGYKAAGNITRVTQILKTKIAHGEHIVYQPDWKVDRWYENTMRTIERMIKAYTSGVWDFNLDEGCAKYGGCGYLRLCSSPSPDSWIPLYYEPYHWDPLAKNEDE